MQESQGLSVIRTETDPRVAAALGKFGDLLVAGEQIEAKAVQRRVFALSSRRIIVVATSGRLVVVARKLLGGFKMTDLRWQDIRDARIDEGIFAATVTAVGKDAKFSVTGLRKQEAQGVYRICQAQEQAWREKNRVREMEELRAKSGGLQLGAGVLAAQSVAAPAVNTDLTARLKRAKDMLDQKLISDSEYQEIKSKVLESV